METTAHFNFIAASYAAAAIVIGALIAWISLDYRAQRRTLAALELQGLTRDALSARNGPAAAQGREAAKEQA
jgi:heme exporter protein D